MNEYVTFKRTALLMLMFIAAWCLPVKGQDNNGYNLWGLTGDSYENSTSGGISSSCSFAFPENAPQTVYALFKLKEPSQIQGFDFVVDGKSFDKSTGELWINLSAFPERYFMYEMKLPGDGSKRTYAYTVSLYGEQNASTTPLAVFSGSKTTRRYAEVTLSTSSIREDLNKPVQFTVSVKANDFLDSTDVRLRINSHGIDNDAFQLETTNGTLTKNGDTYFLPIGKLAVASSYTFTVQAVKAFTGELNFSLVMGQEYTGISWTNSIQMSFPFTPSETDLNGLRKIATDNPSNKALADYIKNEGWKKDIDNNLNEKIGVRWNGSIPARISSLILSEQKNLQVLDVSSFTDLADLTLNNSNVQSLDISMLSKLRYLNIWNTPLTYDKVKLPENTNNLHISGMSTLTTLVLGEPAPGYEGRYQMPAGSEVDLSAYATLNGKKAVFHWYKSGSSELVSLKLDSIAPRKFRMPAQMEGENVWYHCEITSPAFPQWGVRTPFIRLTRGAINYSSDDINRLKALAKANPNCSELQEFIKAEGWKEPWAEYWEDQNRKVAVDWDFSTPARISKLRVQEVDTIVSLDVSGFTEIAYLYCSNLKLKTLDLSKNTKLQQIIAYSNSLTSLDVSKCVNLNYLDCASQRDTNYKGMLTSLNIKGCTKLQTLDIQGNLELDVDLSDAKDLKTLRINSTTKLARYVTTPPASLEQLYYNYTDYPELDLAKCPNIKGYGVPRSVKELDLTNTNIRNLRVDGSGLKYSTLKVNEGTSVDGGSQISVPGLNDEYGYYRIQNGDTIDLSSEAIIDGKASVYTWVDNDSRTEVTNLFLPVKDKPGVFVANGKLDKWYFCIITNEKYIREGWTINSWGGWRLETLHMRIQTPPAAYDETEVAALKAIVDATDSPSLKKWWDSKAWQNGYYPEDSRFQAYWNLDEEANKLHLASLELTNLGDTLTALNVSAFKMLGSLDCYGDSLIALSVKDNSNLRRLNIGWCTSLASLILPADKQNLKELVCAGNKQLTSLDVTGYINLEMLTIRNNMFTVLDVSQNPNLKYLWCNGTPIENLDISKCKKLEAFGVPSIMETFDMNVCDSLKILDPAGSKLKFSTVTLKNGQPWSGDYNCWTEFSIDGIRKPFADYHLLTNSNWVDISSEMMINGQASTVKKSEYMPESSNLTVEVKDGKVRFNGQPREQFSVVVENPVFPNWKIELYGEIYTRDGDANLDNLVNVQDIAATTSWILKDETSMLPWDKFGSYQADVNYDNQWNVADIIGIANIILDKPVTKSNALRSSFIPTVELTAEDGFLYMNTPVAIAGIQLEFTGLKETEGLLGKAATFTQASCLGDTSRILGYSLKGETVPAGKSILMKLPAGARLVKAAFSDEKAQSLLVETRGDLATSNEIVAVPETLQVSNYPNPFRSTTTLVYSLTENVDNAIIQIYATNGRLVHTINGLSVQAGENQYTYSTTLAPGTYFYRLATQKQGATTYSKSNTFIIK